MEKYEDIEKVIEESKRDWALVIGDKLERIPKICPVCKADTDEIFTERVSDIYLLYSKRFIVRRNKKNIPFYCCHKDRFRENVRIYLEDNTLYMYFRNIEYGNLFAKINGLGINIVSDKEKRKWCIGRIRKRITGTLKAIGVSLLILLPIVWILFFVLFLIYNSI